MAKTIKELNLNELKSVVTDLEKGVRYNEIKTKYDLASNAVSANTLAECRKLIAELTPDAPVKTFSGFYNTKHTTLEQQNELIAAGVIVDKEGNFVW